jgi:hypothetical protein
MGLTFCKVLLCELVALAAPLVCLVYRKGWFITPDDPVSPHGQYERKMQGIYRRFGRFVNDWWWLGVRNRGYGLRYALKPAFFKRLTSYEGLQFDHQVNGALTKTTINGTWSEWVWQFDRFHVIYGYRLTPIYNEWRNNQFAAPQWRIPFRPVNMDARPIFSIRAGVAD